MMPSVREGAMVGTEALRTLRHVRAVFGYSAAAKQKLLLAMKSKVYERFLDNILTRTWVA